MAGEGWLWAVDDLHRGGFPNPQKVAAQIESDTEYGARPILLPPEIALYVAGLINGTIKRKRGPKPKVTAYRARTPDILFVEEVGSFKRKLGSLREAFEKIAERDGIDFSTIRQRYYRARGRELTRVPDRHKP